MTGGKELLAVMFAEVSGSARLQERLGRAEASHAVERCLKRLERAVEVGEGRVVSTEGDRLVAVFESADAAGHAAVEMQQRIAGLPPISGVRLSIRVAIHFGPAREEGNGIFGEAVNQAARILDLAQPEQIVMSRSAAENLAAELRSQARDMPAAASAATGICLLELAWHRDEAPVARRPETVRSGATASQVVTKSEAVPASSGEKAPVGTRLCLRYRGRAYLLDDRTPILSLGRDPGSDAVIEDRKASRHHGRIELRGGNFVYVDRSTNGSYVSVGGASETLVRRTEIALLGSGAIGFGASRNDPLADFATFEYL